MSSCETKSMHRRLDKIVDPLHTAVVVWDVQKFLVDQIFNQQEFVQNLSMFLASAREHNIPIIYTRIEPLPITYESSFRTLMFMKTFGFSEPEQVFNLFKSNTELSEIHESVKPQEQDLILGKHTASIFIGTHFEYMMRNKWICTLALTGIATEMGISSTARDSVNRSFYTVVVSDCVSSLDSELHNAAIKILEKICLVETSKEIAQKWP